MFELPSYVTVSSLSSLAVAVATLWAIHRVSRWGRRESFLPPGPPTKPIIGNLDIYPKKSPHLQFTEWSSQYGEIYSLKLAHRNVVVLSSLDAINHVLDKNSAISSDRPPLHIKDRIEGQNNHLGLSRYGKFAFSTPAGQPVLNIRMLSGPRWRSLRRAAQQIMSPTACRRHLDIQQAESVQLLYDIWKDPKGAREHTRRYSTSVIMSVMFGARFPLVTNRLYLEFWDLTEFSLYMTAPTIQPPVDTFPILKYVPERWASWKTKCRELKALQNDVFRRMLAPVEDRLRRQCENGAFMEDVYKRAKEWGLDEDALLPFGFVMTVAGSETTSSFLQYLILCLAAYPHVQQKAQQEIDSIIGEDRMPVLDDFEKLPYLQAVLKETHRLCPVVPLGVPHAASEDIRYKEYIIPKGSIIVQNTWAMFRDSRVFKDPETFCPERFIEDPELSKHIGYIFGSGRRACVGVYLAENSIFINAMNIVWALAISKALDDNGKEIEPDFKNHTTGLGQGPMEVCVSVKPRSLHRETAFLQAFRNAEDSFRAFEHDLDVEERIYIERTRREI